eukprot:Lankesteria_metandrocarpae@DN2260_c0_g1_i1.p1
MEDMRSDFLGSEDVPTITPRRGSDAIPLLVGSVTDALDIGDAELQMKSQPWLKNGTPASTHRERPMPSRAPTASSGMQLGTVLNRSRSNSHRDLHSTTEAASSPVLCMNRVLVSINWTAEDCARAAHVLAASIFGAAVSLGVLFAIYNNAPVVDRGPIPFVLVFRWLPLPLCGIFCNQIVVSVHEAVLYITKTAASIDQLHIAEHGGGLPSDRMSLELSRMLSRTTTEFVIFMGTLLFTSTVLPPKHAALIPSCNVVWCAASLTTFVFQFLTMHGLTTGAGYMWLRRVGPQMVHTVLNIGLLGYACALLATSQNYNSN